MPCADAQVLAVGALHSVNGCVTNTGGTLLNMSSMNEVLGLEGPGVRVQAGCKMAKLYDWLGRHVSFDRTLVHGGSSAGRSRGQPGHKISQPLRLQQLQLHVTQLCLLGCYMLCNVNHTSCIKLTSKTSCSQGTRAHTLWSYQIW